MVHVRDIEPKLRAKVIAGMDSPSVQIAYENGLKLVAPANGTWTYE